MGMRVTKWSACKCATTAAECHYATAKLEVSIFDLMLSLCRVLNSSFCTNTHTHAFAHVVSCPHHAGGINAIILRYPVVFVSCHLMLGCRLLYRWLVSLGS